jgi:hypothetical protein
VHCPDHSSLTIPFHRIDSRRREISSRALCSEEGWLLVMYEQTVSPRNYLFNPNPSVTELSEPNLQLP